MVLCGKIDGYAERLVKVENLPEMTIKKWLNDLSWTFQRIIVEKSWNLSEYLSN